MKKFVGATYIIALIFDSIAFAQSGQTISLKAGFHAQKNIQAASTQH